MTHNKKTPLAEGIGGANGDQYHKDYPNTLPNRQEDKPMTYYNTDDLLQQHNFEYIENNQTEVFLNTLDDQAKAFCFQVFDDSEDKKPTLTAQHHSTYDNIKEKLTKLNDDGAGIFVCVNETNGVSRKKNSITSIRAVFADIDEPKDNQQARLEVLNSILSDCSLAPHMVIESSPCKFHVYWLTEHHEGLLQDFSTIQDAIAARYGTDRAVKDCSRVLRLPGYKHQKTSTPFTVKLWIRQPINARFTHGEIINCFPVQAKESLVDVEPVSSAFPLDSETGNNIVKLFYDNKLIPKEGRRNEFTGAFTGWLARLQVDIESIALMISRLSTDDNSPNDARRAFESYHKQEPMTGFTRLRELNIPDSLLHEIEILVVCNLYQNYQHATYETFRKVLAGINDEAYARHKQRIKKTTGISCSVLDKYRKESKEAVAQQQHQHDAEALVTRVISVAEQVDGLQLANDIDRTLRKHLVLNDELYTVVTLWVMASYLYDEFDTFPRLLITSPQKNCGKTTVLTVIACLCDNVLSASNITSASVFRIIEFVGNPTLLIDEADTFINENNELRGILNSGHSKENAYTTRTETIKNQLVPKKFSTWCPMVIAMIKLPDATLISRSHVIQMKRKTNDKKVAKLNKVNKQAIRYLASRCKKWASDNQVHVPTFLSDFEDQYKEDCFCGLDNRDKDNIVPLWVIARMIGGDWLSKLIRYADKLKGDKVSKRSLAEEFIVYVMSLLKVPQFIEDKAIEGFIKTEDIISAISGIEDSPWFESYVGSKNTQRLDGNQVSFFLKPYGVTSQKIHKTTNRGYNVKELLSELSPYVTDTELKDGVYARLNTKIPSVDFASVCST